MRQATSSTVISDPEDTMKLENKRNETKKIFLYYTGLFLLISAFIVLSLLLNGKSNINRASDGMNQHYRALLYYSAYLKDVFSSLFTKGKLIMPHFEFAIGEGADIISVLHSDAVGDPITFLSVLVPERLLPHFYMFSAFLRVYLAGFFFLKLCLYLGKKNVYGLIAGALTYDFCFWSLESITHHIYFLTPLMILPLLILGLEKILDEKEPFTFVIAVCWGALSWLYFFYMEAAATAIYGVVRVLCRYGKDLKTAIRKLIVILVHALLGVGMAAIILGPMIYAYMSDNRMGIENVVNAFYPAFFYERLLTIFVSNDSTYDLCMGFVFPTLFALLLTLKHIRKSPCLAILNIITFVSVALPICGKILNGFSFVSQRWSFAIALPVAYSLVAEWEEISKERKLLLAESFLFLALSVYSAWSRSERVFVPLVIGLVFLFVATSKPDRRFLQKDLRQLILIALIVCNICYIENYSLSSRGGDVYDDLISFDRAVHLSSIGEAKVIADHIKENETDFYRYTGVGLTNNAAMNVDGKSTAFYWSITNASDQQFRLKLGMQDYICWQIFGYDNRAQLETLSNVKYFIASDRFDGILPYGFEKDADKGGYQIFKNKYVLPFGYTYDEVLSYEDFEKLDCLQRQDAMMDAVILDKESTYTYTGERLKDLDYTIECGEGVSYEDGKLLVSKEKGKITLHLNGEMDQENYLILQDLSFDDVYQIVEDDHTFSSIRVYTDEEYPVVFSYLTKDHHYYFGKNDYVAYLGHGDALKQITMDFSLPGEYSFDLLKVCNQDLNDHETMVDALAKDHLENVEFGADTVTGNISVDHDKYLLVSIPYSKGWKAYLDGKETSLLQANQHYISLFIPKGDHEVVFKYSSPGLLPGALISLCSFALFGVYLYLYRKKK